MNREGEYCAALLCVGGPPDLRPPRDLITGNVDHCQLVDPARSAYSGWASKIRRLAIEKEWIDHPARELFPWITGFLKWFDDMENSREASTD